MRVQTSPRSRSVSLLAALAFSITFAGTMRATDTFAPVPALSFTKPFGGADPLPQIVNISNVGATFSYTIAYSTSSGGSWLSVSPGTGCCETTPSPLTATVTTSPALAVGSYSGQIVVTSYGGAVNMTIPVTLTVVATSAPFLDNLPGDVSFALKTGGTAITSQDIQIRNGASSGTLTWTMTTSTSDGGSWLSASVSSGTAPSTVTIGVNVAHLPSGGLMAGTFVGQLVVQTANGTTTIPVSVVVGTNILSQVNAINFVKVFGGANPLPQTLTFPSTGTALSFTVSSSTASGGSWLSVAPGSGCCESTPNPVTATVVASPTLAVGTYTAQIVVTTYGGAMAITVPVTLTVEAGGAYFDNLPGQISFSMVTGGTAITSQVLEVRNEGTGSLPWTLSDSTSDANPWLTISSSSGVAPFIVTIGVNVANLPNGGLIAGTFVGELVFDSATGRITVPVSVVVASNAFSQVGAINFTKVFGGADPLPQTLTVPSTGTALSFTVSSSTATGGSWLSVSPGAGAARVRQIPLPPPSAPAQRWPSVHTRHKSLLRSMAEL